MRYKWLEADANPWHPLYLLCLGLSVLGLKWSCFPRAELGRGNMPLNTSRRPHPLECGSHPQVCLRLSLPALSSSTRNLPPDPLMTPKKRGGEESSCFTHCALIAGHTGKKGRPAVKSPYCIVQAHPGPPAEQAPPSPGLR